MNTALRAGALYFVVVFFIAFLLGTIRVLFVVPRLGEVNSVLLEAPIILAVSWFASRWTTAKFNVANEISPRLAMGVFAFALLMIVEFGVTTLVFRTPAAAYFAAFWSPQGAIGLIAQATFAFLPAVQRARI